MVTPAPGGAPMSPGQDLAKFCESLPPSEVVTVLRNESMRSETVYLRDGRRWFAGGSLKGEYRLGIPSQRLEAEWLEPVPGTVAWRAWQALAAPGGLDDG